MDKTLNSTMHSWTTETSFEKEHFVTLWVPIVSLCLSVTISLMNLAVLAILTVYKRSRPQGSVFIINLIVSGLIFPVYDMVLYTLSNKSINNYSWNNACSAAVFLLLFAIFATVGNIIAVTLDRFVAVTRPFKYKEIVSPVRTVILITLNWILAISLASLGTVTTKRFHFIPGCPIHHVLCRQISGLVCAILILSFIALFAAYGVITKEVRNNLRRTQPVAQGRFENDHTAINSLRKFPSVIGSSDSVKKRSMKTIAKQDYENNPRCELTNNLANSFCGNYVLRKFPHNVSSECKQEHASKRFNRDRFFSNRAASMPDIQATVRKVGNNLQRYSSEPITSTIGSDNSHEEIYNNSFIPSQLCSTPFCEIQDLEINERVVSKRAQIILSPELLICKLNQLAQGENETLANTSEKNFLNKSSPGFATEKTITTRTSVDKSGYNRIEGIEMSSSYSSRERKRVIKCDKNVTVQQKSIKNRIVYNCALQKQNLMCSVHNFIAGGENIGPDKDHPCAREKRFVSKELSSRRSEHVINHRFFGQRSISLPEPTHLEFLGLHNGRKSNKARERPLKVGDGVIQVADAPLIITPAILEPIERRKTLAVTNRSRISSEVECLYQDANMHIWKDMRQNENPAQFFNIKSEKPDDFFLVRHREGTSIARNECMTGTATGPGTRTVTGAGSGTATGTDSVFNSKYGDLEMRKKNSFSNNRSKTSSSVIKRRGGDKRTIHAAVSVLSLYFVTWMPLVFCLIYIPRNDSFSPHAEIFAHFAYYCVHLNAFFNPILYVVRTRGFKLALRNIIDKLKR